MLVDVSIWLIVYVAIIYAYAVINFFVAGVKDPGVYAKRK